MDEDNESDDVKPILSNRNVSLSVQDVESLLVVLHSPHESLYFYFMNADIQINGNDCGLYAIANATEICHGFDPVIRPD